MAGQTIINEIGEWLIDQALSEPEIVSMFEALCNRLHAAGIPVTRARLTWPTLHPLFQAETILWKMGADTEFEQFRHQDEASEQWLASPMHYMLEKDLDMLRRNLDGPNRLVDFPILEELEQQGFTDYFLKSTPFNGSTRRRVQNETGILVTWSCNREGGFSEDDLAALAKIQRRLATAVKNAVQQRIANNITETYLGHHAAREVLDGAIMLGDGRETQAIVWYADMRDSTALADTMKPDDFLEMLNDYFDCTAGPPIENGGEVLDFIGDAVLAIFPFTTEEERANAVCAANRSMHATFERAQQVNDARRKAGKTPFRFGLGINCGRLMFGNIGVASRLSFSVIGPTINEVERI
ncbi:MAG: adenylate/guanylate cyclase domain-containing protein, partial [Pseudomonadota bacterium]